MKSAGETTTEKEVAQTKNIFKPVMFTFNSKERPIQINAALQPLCSSQPRLVEDRETLD